MEAKVQSFQRLCTPILGNPELWQWYQTSGSLSSMCNTSLSLDLIVVIGETYYSRCLSHITFIKWKVDWLGRKKYGSFQWWSHHHHTIPLYEFFSYGLNGPEFVHTSWLPSCVSKTKHPKEPRTITKPYLHHTGCRSSCIMQACLNEQTCFGCLQINLFD